MAQKKFLAFDFGAESGRAMVGILQDGKLSLDEIHRFPTQGMTINGSLRWNVYRFYEEMLAGMKKYVAKYGPEVESIGVDTWGVDFGLLDERDQLLGLPYHYRDVKNIGTDKALEETYGAKEIYAFSGVQFATINSLNQLVALKALKDPTLPIARHMLFMADLMHYFLTGEKKCEFTLTTTSQLYNAVESRWQHEVFDAFGLPRSICSEVIQAGDRVGALRDDIAEATGLSKGISVISPPAHDTASAAVAVPAVGKRNWAYLSSGTWSIMGMELDKPIITQASYEMNLSNSGGAFKTNILLKNIVGMWVLQQCKRIWNKRDASLGYAQIQQMAAGAQGNVAYIDVDDEAFLNPSDMPQAIVDYIARTGQGSVDKTDIALISRIIFDSLAMKYRYTLNRLESVACVNPDTLFILGGGSQNRLLNQLAANVLQMRVVSGPVEATAIGNVLTQAYGKGLLRGLDDIRSIVVSSFEIETFMPRHTPEEEAEYARFLRVCSLGNP